MALEIEGKREIRLREGLPSGNYGVGTQSIEAEEGKPLTLERWQARLAVNSKNFEYTPKQMETTAPTKEDLLKKSKDDLVKMAMESGASDYISRLKKDELADFILMPLQREKLFSDQPDLQAVPVSDAADDTAGGNE